MLKVEIVTVIRYKIQNEKKSIRRVARELGVSRNTVRKYLKISEPARVESNPRHCPVMDQVAPRIDQLLKEWKSRTTPKQRVTGTRVYEKLREEGYQVGPTTVRKYLAEIKRRNQEVFIPLIHRAGDEAQVDFFEVTVDLNGARRKAWKFVMRLMYSGWDFTGLYERCDQVAFLDGHVRAFQYFNGIPKRCIYDNLSAAVKKVGYPHRKLTSRFQALVSHYSFEPCFARVGEGHDKGGVESRGKGIRLQHLTPIPHGQSLQEISQNLLRRIEEAAQTKKDAKGKAVSEKIAEERQALRPLPAYAFDPSRLRPVSINRKSTITLEGSQYTLPSEWAGLEALAYVGVEQIRVVCREETIILPRQKAGEDCVQYQHYLSEFARKPQAVRQVAPELMRELGEPFQQLWEMLDQSHGGRQAGQVMAKVIQAILDHSREEVSETVQACLKAERVDLLPLLLPKPEPETRTNPVPEALRDISVEQASASDYNVLLQGGAS